MQLFPTRDTFLCAVAAAALLAVGCAARATVVVCMGAGMLLALAWGRAAAHRSVVDLRRGGFEMSWVPRRRLARAVRGEQLRVHAEIRNRSTESVRAVGVRALPSHHVDVRIVPDEIVLPPLGAAEVVVVIDPKRVGRAAIHGLALEVRAPTAGGDGVFETPLLFAHPLGIEIRPRPLATLLRQAEGGRTRRLGGGLAQRRRGESTELLQLRDFVPGDPFRRIAWKASARRRHLVVKDYEQESGDAQWLLVDVSVELWGGPCGRAPADIAVDHVAHVIGHALRRGEPVGLGVFGHRMFAWHEPAEGGAHATRLLASLIHGSSFAEEGRSETDEMEVVRRVAEHMRPLDEQGAAAAARGHWDVVAARAAELIRRAPHAERELLAATPRERALRAYADAYAIDLPPRLEGEGARAREVLASALGQLLRARPLPSRIHVWAPAPTSPIVAVLLRRLRRARVAVVWHLPDWRGVVHRPSRADGASAPASSLAEAAGVALAVRAELAERAARRLLTGLGVRVAPLTWYGPKREGSTGSSA